MVDQSVFGNGGRVMMRQSSGFVRGGDNAKGEAFPFFGHVTQASCSFEVLNWGVRAGAPPRESKRRQRVSNKRSSRLSRDNDVVLHADANSVV